MEFEKLVEAVELAINRQSISCYCDPLSLSLDILCSLKTSQPTLFNDQFHSNQIFSELQSEKNADITDSWLVRRSLSENDILKIDGIWPNLICVLIVITCAALAAGLTTGLLSIEPLEMAIKQRSGHYDEKKQAEKILPIISKHHLLLVTLLLFNSLANEVLPIFLDNILPAYQAVIVSVTLVLFFGEIVPTALFTGPNQLRIASSFSFFVWILIGFFFPISWPIAKVLDACLGKEGFRRYNRAEIAALVEVQQEIAGESSSYYAEDPLQSNEVAILHGTLKAREKYAKDVMLTMDRVFVLSIDESLDENCMADILAAGYSRIPVYEGSDPQNIRGYLQVKKLIVLNPADARKIQSLVLRKPEIVGTSRTLLELLSIFTKSRSHMALVCPSPKLTSEALRHHLPLEGNARPIGIITMEDVIENIIQEEIWDESDSPLLQHESKAKELLLKYTRRRANSRRIGRLSSFISTNETYLDQVLRMSRQPSTEHGEQQTVTENEVTEDISIERDLLTEPLIQHAEVNQENGA